MRFFTILAAVLLLAIPAHAETNLAAGCGGEMLDSDDGIFLVEVSRIEPSRPACAGFEIKLAADGLVLRGPAIPAKFTAKLTAGLSKLEFTAIQNTTRETGDGTEQIVLKPGETAKILVAPAGTDPAGFDQLKKVKKPDGIFYY